MSALEKIIALAPKAVKEAERILNRTYGKPEAALRIETGGRSIAESAAAMQAEIRAVMGTMSEEQEEDEDVK